MKQESSSGNIVNDACQIQFTDHGLEVTGECAQGLTQILSLIYEESKSLGREISACSCIGSRGVEKVVIGEVGSLTSTSLPFGRVCQRNQVQVPIHTHPTSGEAKFSRVDAQTITDRMNRGIDDGHCVTGEDETQCIFKVMMPKEEQTRT